ncbi:MAG: YgjP-like metallopeptidase domain-containing protein [Clostridia bacterium]
MERLNNKKEVIVYSVNRYFNEDVSINIQNGTVVINAPWFFSNNKIKKIIEEKKNVILNKIKEYEEEKSKVYIRNEIVKILGEDCKVIINYKNLKKPTLILEGRNLTICLPNKYKKITDRDEILQKLIEKLYEKIAAEEIEAIMEKIRRILKIVPEDYKIKKLQTNTMAKFNFDENTIIISPEIVKYSKEEIEFIIFHQFCHLKYKTHCQKFQQMIKKHIPEYKKYEELLKDIKF